MVELNSASVLARNDATYMQAYVQLGDGSSFSVMEGGGAVGTGAQPRAVVRANFGGFLRYYKTYGKTFSAELAVTCFDVEDRASPSTVHPRIIKPLAGYQEETEEAGRGGGGDGNHIVWLRVHASPPDRPDLDMDVQVRARPLLVTFAPEPLRALARLTAHVEEGSASKGVSEVATRVYSDSYDALASAARIQLDVTIAAPVLLLPARLDDGGADALALQLQLGSLRVTSTTFDDERAPRAARNRRRGGGALEALPVGLARLPILAP